MLMTKMLAGIVGLILISAPFLFGFYDNFIATWASIAAGMTLFINASIQAMNSYEFEDEDEFESSE